jgi:hypothetical protein
MSTGDIIFIVAIIAAVAALVIWIAIISARAKRLSAASDARLATELHVLAANPPAAAPPSLVTPTVHPYAVDDSTKEERLSELADLRARSLISDDELATARAKILAE